MAETRRLTIDVPGFYVDDVRKGAAAAGVTFDDYLEDAMLCDAGVVIVFHRYDEVDGHVLEHLAGRIVARDVAVDGRVAAPVERS